MTAVIPSEKQIAIEEDTDQIIIVSKPLVKRDLLKTANPMSTLNLRSKYNVREWVADLKAKPAVKDKRKLVIERHVDMLSSEEEGDG